MYDSLNDDEEGKAPTGAPSAPKSKRTAKKRSDSSKLAQRIEEVASQLKGSIEDDPADVSPGEFEATDLETTSGAGLEPAAEGSSQETDLLPAEAEAAPADELHPAEAVPVDGLEPAAEQTSLEIEPGLEEAETAVALELEPAEPEPALEGEPESAAAGEVQPSEPQVDMPEAVFSSDQEPGTLTPLQEMQAKPTPAEQGNWVTRGQAFWLALGSSALALLLALVISLGILASLNRGQLQYASPAQINDLAVRMDGLNIRAEVLEQDLQGLRTRLDNLEALGGRVNAVEEAAAQLKSDFDQAATRLQGLEAEVTGLNSRVESLETNGERVMGFLDGLRSLLNDVFTPQEGGK